MLLVPHSLPPRRARPQTVRNDNSSRFGKLVLIDFSKTGRLIGASMQTYLLEKSRVSNLSDGESTFHAFYETVTGLDPARQRECCLPARGNALRLFNYLKGDGSTAKRREEAKDKANFERAQQALVAVGLDLTQREGIRCTRWVRGWVEEDAGC